MRLVRVLLLCILIILGSATWSQAQPDIGCDDLVKSSFDTLWVPFSEGRPGDTVLIPVALNHDSIITAFQFLIKYDTIWLTPLYVRDSMCDVFDNLGNCLQWNIDSTFIDYVVGGRFVKTKTTQGPFGPIIDTVTKFQANRFQDFPDVVAGSFLPEFDDIDSLLPPDPLVPGSDTIPIFYLKFVVNPAMPEMSLTEFTFHESLIFVVDTSTPWPYDTTYFNGCHESQMTTVWAKGLDSTSSFQVYPTTDRGYSYYFRANSNVVDPPTVSLTASPTSIIEGGSSSLIWTSTNADSVVLRAQPSGVRLSDAANGAISGSIVISGLLEGTHNYSATAFGLGGTATGAAAIVVDTAGTKLGPVISVSAVQGSYSQGELIAFTVTATNISGAQINMIASSVPANGNFGISNQVTGFSPLTGDFTWTPDFNQSGLFTIRFTASDNGGTTIKDVVFQINELQFDRLFSTSAPGNRPTGGLRGRHGIPFPIDLITSQTVYGVQFDLRYPYSKVRVDSFATTARIPDYVVYENIGQTPGDIRVVTFGLNNEPVNDTNTTAILYAYMSLDSSAIPWDSYTIYLEDGRESVNPDPMVGGLPLVTDSGIIEVDNPGDVNLDKFIDVADVVNTVAYIIGNFGLQPRQYEVADVVVNDSVNVFDLVTIVNLIYPQPLPTPAVPPPGEEVMVGLSYSSLSGGQSEVMTVTSEIPTQVAGVQLELSYDPSAVSFGTPTLTDDNPYFSISSNDNGQGRLKLVMFHMAPSNSDELIQTGMVDLVRIPIQALTDVREGDKTKIRLSEAMFSTAASRSIAVNGVDAPLPSTFVLRQNYPNPFNPSTTIEFVVDVSLSGSSVRQVNLDIFNILGQHVNSLADGFYPAGEHSVIWDATDRNGSRVATGVYLYRIQIGDEQQTKKMLFLK